MQIHSHKKHPKLRLALLILGGLMVPFSLLLNVKADDDPLYELTWEQYNYVPNPKINSNKMIGASGGGYINVGYYTENSVQKGGIEKIREVSNGMEREWIATSQVSGVTYYSVAEVSADEYVVVGKYRYGSSPNNTIKYQGFISRFEKDGNGDFVETETMVFNWGDIDSYMDNNDPAYQTIFDDVALTNDNKMLIAGHRNQYRGTSSSSLQESLYFVLEVDDTIACSQEDAGKLCAEKIVWSAMNGDPIGGANTYQNKIVHAPGSDKFYVTRIGSNRKIFEINTENGELLELETELNHKDSISSAYEGEFVSTLQCTYDAMNTVWTGSGKVSKNVKINSMIPSAPLWNFGDNHHSHDTFCPGGAVVTSDNQYIVYGRVYFYSENPGANNTTYHKFLQKTDSDGNVLWEYVSSDTGGAFTNAISSTENGEYILYDHYGKYTKLKDLTAYVNVNYHIVSQVKPRALSHSNTQYPNRLETNKSNRTSILKNSNLSAQDLENYDDFAGYEFDGWYTSETLEEGTEFTVDEQTPVTQDIDLYGSYSKIQYDIPVYTIKYEGETQTGEPVQHADAVAFVDDVINAPDVSESGYTFDGWYTGTIVNGERVYDTSTKLGEDFTFQPSQIGQFDFIWAKLQHQTFTVYYNNVYSNNVCSEEYRDDMIPTMIENNYPQWKELVGYGQTINLKTSAPDKSCFLTDLKSGQDYNQLNSDPQDFSIDTPITSNIYIGGTYEPMYLVVRDDEVFYADGDRLDSTITQGVSFEPSEIEGQNDKLYLEDFDGMYIHFENGENPIEIVLSGDNSTRIISSATPIIVSGDGTLSDNSENYSERRTPISAVGTSVTIESGEITGNTSADIITMNGGKATRVPSGSSYYKVMEANNITINGGEIVDGRIYIGFEGVSYSGTTGFTVNGGKLSSDDTDVIFYVPGDTIITGGDLSAWGGSINHSWDNNGFGDLIINAEGDSKINIGAAVRGNVIINNGVVSSRYDISAKTRTNSNDEEEGGIIIINGGEVSARSLEGDRAVIINNGAVNLTRGINAEKLFALNDGELNIVDTALSSSDSSPLEIENGFAVFNGGKATIRSAYPATINYPSSLDADTTALLESDLGVSLEDVNPGSGLIFNGGDVTFSKITADDLVAGYAAEYIQEIEESLGNPEVMASACTPESEMYMQVDMSVGYLRSWKVNITPVMDNGVQALDENDNILVLAQAKDENGALLVVDGEPVMVSATLIPLVDENDDPVMIPEIDLAASIDGPVPATDENGDPIMHQVYKVVDENDNIIYSKVFESEDENGNKAFYKAGFDGQNDCINNFIEQYTNLMLVSMSMSASEELANTSLPPILVTVMSTDGNNQANQSSIFIKDGLVTDPDNLSIRAVNVDAGNNVATSIATFGDNEEGEAVFTSSEGDNDEVIYTTEHILTDYAHIYEDQGRTITWQNEDGTVLETDENVALGTLPTYDGETPTKEATAEYTYTFYGWSPEVEEVSGDQTYTAQFTETKNSYTITFNNYDGTELQSGAIEYGEEVSIPQTNPTKETTPAYEYVFTGWTDGENTYSDGIPTVSGDKTYTPVFTPQAYTPSYEWIDNSNDYTVGTDEQAILKIEIARKFFHSIVKVEDEVITEGTDYVVTEGSTIITLQKDYLDSLETGGYIIDVYFDEPTSDEDVMVSTMFTVTRNSDNQGDDELGNPDNPTNPINNNDPDNPTNPSGDTDPDNPGNNDNPENKPSVPSSDEGTDGKPGAGNHGFGHIEPSSAIASIAIAIIVSLTSAIGLKKIKSRK